MYTKCQLISRAIFINSCHGNVSSITMKSNLLAAFTATYARAPQSRDHYCSRLCQLSCSDNESIIINNLHDIWYELAQLGGELSLYTLTAHNSTHFQINQIIIPTVETTRQKYLLQKFIENNCFSLFVGPTGTGKSAITNDYVLSLPSAE